MRVSDFAADEPVADDAGMEGEDGMIYSGYAKFSSVGWVLRRCVFVGGSGCGYSGGPDRRSGGGVT
jgi:hypothetical protein